MKLPNPALGLLAGSFVGEGVWLDTEGQSKPYRARQSVVVGDNSISVDYAHDFYEEGTSSAGTFYFALLNDHLFRVLMKHVHIGHGYMFGEHLYFYVQPGDAYVQVSYGVSLAGIVVNGSSSKNAEGKFIAWHESLRREASSVP